MRARSVSNYAQCGESGLRKSRWTSNESGHPVKMDVADVQKAECRADSGQARENSSHSTQVNYRGRKGEHCWALVLLVGFERAPG